MRIFRSTRKRRTRGKKKKLFLLRHPLVTLLLVGVLGCIIAVGWLFISLPDVSFLKSDHPPITAFMRLRLNQAQGEGKSIHLHQDWMPYSRFPLLLRRAVVASEDAAFFSHDGVDYNELKASLEKNFKEGRRARGGSTITMQVARNLFLSPRKSILRKVREVLIARRLEGELDKHRILHLYLNIAEMGRGVFGFPAGAKKYFGLSLEALNPTQVLRLVAVLPKPLRVSPLSNSRYLKWRVRLVADRMVQRGHLTVAQRAEIEFDLANTPST